MNRKPSLLVVFLTVFIDLIGFGIVVPLVPIFSRHYGAGGFVIGAIDFTGAHRAPLQKMRNSAITC
jgi:hypothetical protein